MRTTALCFASCLIACLPVRAQDRSTPEATVRSFLEAFGRGDVKQAASCVKGVQMSDAALEVLGQQVRKEPASFTLSDTKTAVEGTNATFSGQVSVKSGTSAKAQTFSTKLNLASSGEAWQIVPDSARARQDNGADLANGLAYMLTDPNTLTRARDSARTTSCLSNVKQLCVGALMLSQDYDEVFKVRADSFRKSLMPYVKNANLFRCPSDSSGSASYSFNEHLAGVPQAKVRAPAETVLIYEGTHGKLVFRHDGRATVGFADGHVKLLNAEQAKKLRWMP